MELLNNHMGVSRLILSEKSFRISSLLTGLFIFFALLSPTFAVVKLGNEIIGIIYYLALSLFSLSILVLKFRYRIFDFAIFSILFLFLLLVMDLPKASLFALAIPASFISFQKNESMYVGSILALLFINFIVTLGQLSGEFDILFNWVRYANEENPTAFFSSIHIPASFLPQFRPSGIFPSPTYTNIFSIIVFSTLVWKKGSISNKWVSIAGIYFLMVGSTMGLLLSIFCVFLLPLRSALILSVSYISAMLLYFIFLPDFFYYNFSYNDLLTSVFYRDMNESILTLNPSLFIMIFFLASLCAFSLVMRYGFSEITRNFPPLLLLLAPTLLHDISGSLMYSFIVGMSFAMLKRDKKPLSSANYHSIKKP